MSIPREQDTIVYRNVIHYTNGVTFTGGVRWKRASALDAAALSVERGHEVNRVETQEWAGGDLPWITTWVTIPSLSGAVTVEQFPGAQAQIKYPDPAPGPDSRRNEKARIKRCTTSTM